MPQRPAEKAELIGVYRETKESSASQEVLIEKIQAVFEGNEKSISCLPHSVEKVKEVDEGAEVKEARAAFERGDFQTAYQLYLKELTNITSEGKKKDALLNAVALSKLEWTLAQISSLSAPELYTALAEIDRHRQQMTAHFVLSKEEDAQFNRKYYLLVFVKSEKNIVNSKHASFENKKKTLELVLNKIKVFYEKNPKSELVRVRQYDQLLIGIGKDDELESFRYLLLGAVQCQIALFSATELSVPFQEAFASFAACCLKVSEHRKLSCEAVGTALRIESLLIASKTVRSDVASPLSSSTVSPKNASSSQRETTALVDLLILSLQKV